MTFHARCVAQFASYPPSTVSGSLRWTSARPYGLSGPIRGRGGLGHHAGVAPPVADLAPDRAVLVEPPVDEVLVVRDGDVAGDHHPPAAAHLGPDHPVDVL